MPHRREFLQSAAAATAAIGVTDADALSPATGAPPRPHLAVNEFTWATFYRREGREPRDDLDGTLDEVVAAGFNGFEPNGDSPEFVRDLAPRLAAHGLAMRSIYVNSTLHDRAQANASIDQVVAVAEEAHERCGTTIVVTNPSPIRWGGPENKSDDQLKTQAEALGRLGERLARGGVTLAYHNHDAELRLAAREFHHMLAATDPRHVRFCLDAHWVYRGAGDSQVALLDVLRLYGDRIVELHLRQSRGGVWGERFGPGDIDYAALARQLRQIGARPHVTIEQAVEEGSPRKLGVVESQRSSRLAATEIFFAAS